MGDLIDDSVKWLKALLMGDWDENAPTSTVIINGLLGLIPVIDQILDVRDVAGVLFRINRNGGLAKASREEKLNLALAALGCIPEFGSAMKTALKVLWKERKVAGKFIQGGVELLERMRGMKKGAAITWAKTLQWGHLAQEAAVKIDLALAAMIQLLRWLSAPRWWVPDSLEGLAMDLLPSIRGMQGKYNAALNEGIYAVRDFVNELLGEDAAVLVVAMAQQMPSHHSSVHSKSEKRTGKYQQTSVKGERPANKNADQHKDINGTKAQSADKGTTGRPSMTTALTQSALKAATKSYRALLGEHMGDYHHMKQVGGNWPHGQVEGSKPTPKWSSTAKLVNEKTPSQDSSPTELVAEHIKRPYQKGIDGVWSLGGGTYHFVEAKCYESPGSIVYFGDKATRPHTNKKTGKEKPATRFEPPPNLTERQLSLWYLLSQPDTLGLQMSKKWVKASTLRAITTEKNINNRFVYLFLIVPGKFKPLKGYTLKPGTSVKGGMAGGMADHGVALTMAATAKEGLHDPEVYNYHKPTHEFSDQFSYQEVDFLDNEYKDILKSNPQSPKQPKTDKPAPNNRPTRSGRPTGRR